MEHTMSRRNFVLKTAILGSAVVATGLFPKNRGNENNYAIDYHVHLTNSFTIEKAVALSDKINVKFGIVAHPGGLLKGDEGLKAYIDKLRQYPVYVGLQPVYRNWTREYSQELIDQLDYVLMDADTIPLKNDQYLRIWRHDNYIDHIEDFMALYMAHIEDILLNEPITIFARPTYLPVNFARYYEQIWTEERMMRIISLAKQNNIALEISTPMHVPNKKFILLAKENGLKFTFGTNARNESAGKFHYGYKMMKDCNLADENMLFL
jgi:histidinol phosphatase-like PHP family hydrolase